MIRSTSIIAYPLHVDRLHVSARNGQFLLNSEHKLVGFLLVCFTDKKLEEKRLGEDEEMSV